MRITSPYGADSYEAGGTYALCDECGLKFRLSDLRKRWDSALVCKKDWEPQHPQEFLRGRADRIKPPGQVRPEGSDVFRATLVTQDDL